MCATAFDVNNDVLFFLLLLIRLVSSIVIVITFVIVIVLLIGIGVIGIGIIYITFVFTSVPFIKNIRAGVHLRFRFGVFLITIHRFECQICSLFIAAMALFKSLSSGSPILVGTQMHAPRIGE